MESNVFWTLFALGCVAAVTNSQPDTRCVETLFNDVGTCFTRQGLDLSVQSGQQDATTLMRETQAMDPSAQCVDLDAYKKAINCSLTVLRQCLSNVNMGGSIPDPSNFQKGMDVICQRQDDFDSACLKQHYPHILKCGEYTVKSVVQDREGKESLTMDQIICLSSDVNYDCSRKHLHYCSNTTRLIYLEQLNKYQVPSACVNRPPGRPGREIYVDIPSDTGAATAAFLGGLAAVVSLLLHLLLLH